MEMGVVSHNVEVAVASAPPNAVVDGASAAVAPTRRIPTTHRPVLSSKRIFGRKKPEVVEGKKFPTSSCYVFLTELF